MSTPTEKNWTCITAQTLQAEDPERPRNHQELMPGLTRGSNQAVHSQRANRTQRQSELEHQQQEIYRSDLEHLKDSYALHIVATRLAKHIEYLNSLSGQTQSKELLAADEIIADCIGENRLLVNAELELKMAMLKLQESESKEDVWTKQEEKGSCAGRGGEGSGEVRKRTKVSIHDLVR